jgi:integrase
MKRLKLRAYIEQRVKAGDSLEPSDVQEGWYKLTSRREPTFQAISQMLKRMKLDKAGREQLVIFRWNRQVGRDILEYQEWLDYKANSGKVQVDRVDDNAKYLREVWEWFGKADPHTWKYTQLLAKLEEKYPKHINEKRQSVFNHPAAVQRYLSAVNTVFKGIIPESFSGDLSRKAGELKDYFTFQEFDDFINQLTATEELSQIGWEALYEVQESGGMREGRNKINGILGLKWENINFSTRRCSVNEKGGRGDASRMWVNVPLDLFPWRHSWDKLMKYWAERGNPASGRVFPIEYDTYLDKFHATRKACNGRIAGKKETFKPHILRKTHAQWLRKLRVPLEIIAGAFPDGSFGVGWDNINILKGYYVTIEPDEYEEAEAKAQQRMKVLGLA